MTLLNDILSEWAMKSEDGLAQGYNTTENIQVLRETLASHNITGKLADDFISDVINK